MDGYVSVSPGRAAVRRVSSAGERIAKASREKHFYAQFGAVLTQFAEPVVAAGACPPLFHRALVKFDFFLFARHVQTDTPSCV